LPSPNTTALQWMNRLGWTACTCWPTIALMAGAGEPSGQLQLKLLGAVV